MQLINSGGATLTIEFLDKFQKIFEQYKEHDGKKFQVLSGKTKQFSDIPEEDFIAFEIKLETGETIVAVPEEIVKSVNGEILHVRSGSKQIR